LISEQISKVNSRLPKEQRVKRFVNTPKELDPDEAELTRTMKLRRGFVEDRYKSLIGALYGESQTAVMEVSVLYRDGRQAVLRADVQVNRID
jgi:long-chain acyl-CoA synthetase